MSNTPSLDINKLTIDYTVLTIDWAKILENTIDGTEFPLISPKIYMIHTYK